MQVYDRVDRSPLFRRRLRHFSSDWELLGLSVPVAAYLGFGGSPIRGFSCSTHDMGCIQRALIL